MSAHTLLLLMLDIWDEKMQGRTVVQKCAYFVGHLAGKELRFRPHFYGPFSAVVERGISDLCGLGFVREHVSRVSGDWPGASGRLRYDYVITSDGDKMAKNLYEHSSKDVRAVCEAVGKIKSAGWNMRATTWSVAAKTHFILSSEDAALTTEAVVEHAEKLSWEIKRTDVCEAVDFLTELDLVQRVSNSK